MKNKFSFTGKVQIALPRGIASSENNRLSDNFSSSIGKIIRFKGATKLYFI